MPKRVTEIYRQTEWIAYTDMLEWISWKVKTTNSFIPFFLLEPGDLNISHSSHPLKDDPWQQEDMMESSPFNFQKLMVLSLNKTLPVGCKFRYIYLWKFPLSLLNYHYYKHRLYKKKKCDVRLLINLYSMS